MLRVTSALMLLAALACMVVLAQAPTGIITGTLTDESGAVIPNATITITNKATGVAARTATTDAQGYYSAPALPAGDYEVRAEVSGFRTVQRDATVLAGSTTTVNMPMTLGATKEVVTVEAATSQINYETHKIEGVISRSTIQDLPSERPQLHATGDARTWRARSPREQSRSSMPCSPSAFWAAATGRQSPSTAATSPTTSTSAAACPP